jgi:hypothetical protein
MFTSNLLSPVDESLIEKSLPEGLTLNSTPVAPNGAGLTSI